MEEVNVTTPREEETSEKLLKLGVIGMGNCGGQMADLVSANLDLDAIAINASEKDINMLRAENIAAIVVGDGKGTGKNREEAAEFLLGKINMVQDDSFREFIDKIGRAHV